jgi:predicted RNase H-like nuclease (RuvC/YqgF family)
MDAGEECGRGWGVSQTEGVGMGVEKVSETPRTDNAQLFWHTRDLWVIPSTAAKKLERELNEMRENFNALQHALVGDTGASAILTAGALRDELAQMTRERDEARALNAAWEEKAATWMASPEFAQRLQGYRDMGQQVAQAQNERDALRAEVAALQKNWETDLDKARKEMDRATESSFQQMRKREVALRAEVERLSRCIKRANDQAEEFERKWYLRGDEVERLRGALQELALGNAGDVYQTMIFAHNALEQEPTP